MDKQLILNKIEEMKSENEKLWNELLFSSDIKFDSNKYESNFLNNYNGENFSHILDIIDEQNWILQRLELYINNN